MQIVNDWLKLPENYNKGFWQYNEFNINELAFHNHDGENGDLLPPSSLVQLIASFNTTVAEGALFSATIALPTDNTFDNTTITFFDDAGSRAFLDFEKVDDDNYKVFSAYNSITFEARYA